MASSSWIMEGNYSKSASVREERADTLIYLELPLYLCLYRVLKRRIRYHRQTRPELGEACPEKLDWKFLKYIVTTYKRRRVDMRKRIKRFLIEGKKVVHLQSRREIQEFISQIE